MRPPLVVPGPGPSAAPTECTPDLLAALEGRDIPALRAALDDAYGPVGELAALGLVLINEQEPSALTVAWKGLALLRPGVLAQPDTGYRHEVVAMLGLLAGTTTTDPMGERLTRWAEDLLVERCTDLTLTRQDLEGYDATRMRTLAQRLEARVLRSTLARGGVAPGEPNAVRPRL